MSNSPKCLDFLSEAEPLRSPSDAENGRDKAAAHAYRIVVTAGVAGSASTWAFNVVRELMAASFGAHAVIGVFAESPAALYANPAIGGRHLVCKTHGWLNLHQFAHQNAATVIVTVRDPRDSVLSFAERFGYSLAEVVPGIAQHCQHMIACADAGHPVLRYEERFFDNVATVRALARHIGIEVSDGVAGEIFNKYRTEVVRAFAATVPSLPQERLGGDDKRPYDLTTHIYKTHIGDGRVDKWRERLDARQRAELTRLFAPFLARFGYPAE
jgi:hypothetical protein